MNLHMDNKKIVVLGKGFLGKAFEGYDATVLDRSEFEYNFRNWNADTVAYQIGKIVDKYNPVCIVNCIGSANTRQCEDPNFWSVARAINGDLPELLSEACYEHGVKFVHISTGCVYDSNESPQKEDGFLVSHCKYVVSKLNGEYGCDELVDLIIRPRLYFGKNSDRNNLLTKIPKFTKFLTEENSYTSVETIVEAVIALVGNGCTGVFNVANTGTMTLKDVAELLMPERSPFEEISADDLKEREGLFLVNNIMDISKLEEYYSPRTLENELTDCYNSILNGN